VRVPALVLAGGGAYVTYTNALFERRAETRIIYLPTYQLPALDDAGIATRASRSPRSTSRRSTGSAAS
jgi:hypothetical protein